MESRRVFFVAHMISLKISCWSQDDPQDASFRLLAVTTYHHPPWVLPRKSCNAYYRFLLPYTYSPTIDRNIYIYTPFFGAINILYMIHYSPTKQDGIPARHPGPGFCHPLVFGVSWWTVKTLMTFHEILVASQASLKWLIIPKSLGSIKSPNKTI